MKTAVKYVQGSQYDLEFKDPNTGASLVVCMTRTELFELMFQIQRETFCTVRKGLEHERMCDPGEATLSIEGLVRSADYPLPTAKDWQGVDNEFVAEIRATMLANEETKANEPTIVVMNTEGE